jgi:hypothetical protein
MIAVTTEAAAAVRWRNLNVLHDNVRNQIVIMGQTENGNAFWQVCGVKPEDSLSAVAAKFQCALDGLRMKAVRHADECSPITDKEFFSITISDGRFLGV